MLDSWHLLSIAASFDVQIEAGHSTRNRRKRSVCPRQRKPDQCLILLACRHRLWPRPPCLASFRPHALTLACSIYCGVCCNHKHAHIKAAKKYVLALRVRSWHLLSIVAIFNVQIEAQRSTMKRRRRSVCQELMLTQALTVTGTSARMSKWPG